MGSLCKIHSVGLNIVVIQGLSHQRPHLISMLERWMKNGLRIFDYQESLSLLDHCEYLPNTTKILKRTINGKAIRVGPQLSTEV